MEDLSVLGVKFVSDHRLSPGGMLTVKIHFPRAFRREPLKVRAEVVRSWDRPAGGYWTACKFHAGETGTGEALASFVSWTHAGRARP